MTQTIKSVHIEGCWPYKYELVIRRTFKRETMDRANARKREIYHQKKKRIKDGQVNVCKELNDAATNKSSK